MDPKRKSDRMGAASALGRPALMVIVVAGLIAVILWQMDMPSQGSEVPGVNQGQVRGSAVDFDPSEVIEGSADATDLETVEDLDPPDVPQDAAKRRNSGIRGPVDRKGCFDARLLNGASAGSI